VTHVDVRVVRQPDHTDAEVLVVAEATDAAPERLVGHMEARRVDGAWHLVGPIGAPPADALVALLQATVDACAREAPGEMRWWVKPVDDATEAAASRAGFTANRELLQMRRGLPVGEPYELATRPFRVDADEAAWLEVNNAAFAWHEDQSHWTAADLEAREREPWFDPAGFLLTEIDGRLAGFCWTKVHDDTEPRLGEIFVIAVHPDFHGRGLGRALTLAGLDHLARNGLDVGMLYVEADNVAARSLYEDLGFAVHHRDRRYVRELP
jgi:mycothiol synthase